MKTEHEWLSVMAGLGYQGTEVRHHVLLVVHATECAPCLRELAWWTTRGKEKTGADVSLVVIEKHKTVFNAFVEAKDIEIPVFWDSSATMFEQELIPTTPVKLYFNEQGHILSIDHMGANGDIRPFLKKIKEVHKKR